MLKFIVGLTGEFYKANTTVYVHILFNCRCLNKAFTVVPQQIYFEIYIGDQHFDS